MPHINPDKLKECLMNLHTAISAVWLECKNNELCEMLRQQLDYIESIVKTIENANL
jgi:hypothetical protein